jgi:ubiquinone/menaquinone biosynthesis C-methylase UbiE
VARESIVQAIGLKEGMSIADVGSGTGLFVKPFSTAVGATGQVFAIDIAPRFVDYLQRRAVAEELDNVTVVRNTARSLMLMKNKVDRVFVCDTYHHFDHQWDMLASIFEALEPGGELILIDFERLPGTSREWVLNHVRADKGTFKDEIVTAGFEFVEEVTIPQFRENYFLRFRKPSRN